MTEREYRYLLRLPVALERARRRIQQLEADARRFGAHHLLEAAND